LVRLCTNQTTEGLLQVDHNTDGLMDADHDTDGPMDANNNIKHGHTTDGLFGHRP